MYNISDYFTLVWIAKYKFPKKRLYLENTHAYSDSYMYAMTINEKETINLKWNKEMNVGRFRGRKGNEEM